MNLAISNIAWLPEEEAEALALLHDEGVSFLEIAPTRYWPDPAKASVEDARRLRQQLQAQRLSAAAFQAILFGKPDLSLFGEDRSRRACVEYLAHIGRLAAACGAGPMVFGAPKNRRVPPSMSTPEADRLAASVFRELAERVAGLGVCFCIEPNPSAYECNYLTHVADAARLVRRIDRAEVRLQLDAGELALNEENVRHVVAENAALIGHVHISQPMLGDFETPWPGHRTLSEALVGANYKGFVSIEMKRPKTGLNGVRRAIEFAKDCYGKI